MEKNEGVSLGKVFKVAFKRWKLLTIVTLGFTAVGFLGIYFGLNALRSSYSTSFSYNANGLTKEKYADESNFSYGDIVSRKSLETVKNSDEKYASINIDKILDNNAITMTGTVSESSSGNYDRIIYTLSIQKRFFISDFDLARSFMADLTELPLIRNINYVENAAFDDALLKIDSAASFEDQISLLALQRDNLLANYEYLTTNQLVYGYSDLAISNAKAVENAFDKNEVTYLMNLVSTYGLALDYKALDVDALNTRKGMLDAEKVNNNALIDSLNAEITSLGTSAAIAELGETIEELIIRNNEIDNEVTAIDNKIANFGKEASDVTNHTFLVSEIQNDKALLEDCVKSYRSLLEKIYINDSQVSYVDSSIITVKGSLSIPVAIVLPLVTGFVIGIIVNLIVDRKKLYED